MERADNNRIDDPLGLAIADYHYRRRLGKLWIHNRYGDKEQMPISAYFRSFIEMPAIEHFALKRCKGKILDIGAGAGSHALYLQEQGEEVTAIEASGLSVQVMNARGVRNLVHADVFEWQGAKFDTLLLMMNGIGLAGTIEGLRKFFRHADSLLAPKGQLLFDSSDVAYVYENHLPSTDHYYGEIAYQYEYKKRKTCWFNWLYIDRYTLSSVAEQEGWRVELLTEDKHGQYLVRLTRNDGAPKG